jgi:hypothetical protein
VVPKTPPSKSKSVIVEDKNAPVVEMRDIRLD